MGSLRLAILGGGLFGIALVGACGLEVGGPGETDDSGVSDPDVFNMVDAADVQSLPDAPMDIMTPDLGTGETEAGMLCTCTPALPAGGWTFGAYLGTRAAGCPKSYASQQDIVENLTAQASTCTCNCNGGLTTQPTCGGGDVNFNYGWGTANNSCAKFTGQVSCNPNCKSTSATANGSGGDFGYMQFSPNITAAGGSCAKENVVTTIPKPSNTDSRVCTLQGAPGTCGPGACVPTPTDGYGVCIVKSGVQTCPSDFPNTHFVGDGFDDTRNCGPDACACTLARGNCTTQVTAYYGSNNCTAGQWNSSPQPPDAVCKATGYGGTGANINSCKYTSTNSGASCTFTGMYTAQGGLTLKNTATICCL